MLPILTTEVMTAGAGVAASLFSFTIRSLVTGYRFGHRSFSTSKFNMSKAVVLLAPGAEEMETVICADVLRRGGVDVTIAGLTDSEPVKCSRNVTIKPDAALKSIFDSGPYDAVILPGGLGGSQALATSELVGKLLKEQEAAGRIVAAICAAPTALKAHGIGRGKRLTSYPSTAEAMKEGGAYEYVDDSPVIVDGKLVTSRGPGTAIAFALCLVELLVNKQKAQETAKGMLLKY